MNDLARRIARSLPGASFELETLVRLVGIEESTEVTSAAVTCAGRPRLLLNPEFVNQYCQHDEHLFLLVMHEMWHVLLGHTTLYGRPTVIHNIAFDALINAGLSRQHPEPGYRGFFETINPADTFPALLLRPPLGWPENPVYKVPGPRGTKDILRRLYPAPDDKPILEPLFEEILELLKRSGVTGDATGDGTISGLPAGTVLLGDHREEPPGSGKYVEYDPLADSAFTDVVRRVVATWPPPPVILAGRDEGGDPRNAWFEPRISAKAARSEFVDVLERAVSPDPTGKRRTRRDLVTVTAGPGPLPNAADRHQHAKRLLRPGIVLPNQRITVPRTRHDRPVKALVYLDVSGSMNRILPHLLDLLVRPARERLIDVRQFSTTVHPLTTSDLAAGKLQTTGGTDIACVMEDVLATDVTRVVIVTDGYVGQPHERHRKALLERGIRVFAVLPAGGWTRDLSDMGEIVMLPNLEVVDE